MSHSVTADRGPSVKVNPCPTRERIPLSGAVTGLTETEAHATSHQLEINQEGVYLSLRRLASLKNRR